MEIESIVIPATNDFASLYLEQKEPVRGFFHYNIKENNVFEKRYDDLMNREFDRAQLSKVIEQYVLRFPHSSATLESLKKLNDKKSVVVIGGQQAGLLSGPLYTIHKIISIIKLAKEQETKLNVPVVPIFWIAGEDHDFLEINHVFANVGTSMRKINFKAKYEEKRMTSDIEFDKQEMEKWVQTVFMHFGERKFTKKWLTFIHNAIKDSKTITDFFAYIIMSLFKDYGLLIVDSADPQLRKIERPFFSQLIDQNKEITHAVLTQQDIIKGYGFTNAIDIDPHTANLFYYLNHERILLSYNSDLDQFESKQYHLQINKEEIKQLLISQPERFSNNVVTRPLMQEWLFPTLAFIAGPGEIAYWGELKQAFNYVGFNMPPIIPRMNITFVDATIERDIRELELSFDEVLKAGVTSEKLQFLQNTQDQILHDIINNISTYLTEQYQLIFNRLEETERGLLGIANKNLTFHLNQIDFLAKKSDQMKELKHQSIIEKFNRVERFLRPNGSPQERVWNIFYYLCEYDEPLIHKLMDLELQFDGKHKIIKI